MLLLLQLPPPLQHSLPLSAKPSEELTPKLKVTVSFRYRLISAYYVNTLLVPLLTRTRLALTINLCSWKCKFAAIYR